MPKGFLAVAVPHWSGHAVTVARTVRSSDRGISVAGVKCRVANASPGQVVRVTVTPEQFTVCDDRGSALRAVPTELSSSAMAMLESEVVARPCPRCGTAVPPASGRRGRRQVYCSDSCVRRTDSDKVAAERAAAREALRCHQCGGAFAVSRSDQMYCSPDCREVGTGQRRPEPFPVRACALPTCDERFTPMFERQRCCCEDHGKVFWRLNAAAAGYKNPRQPWEGKRKEAHQRRRAQKKGASTGERVVAVDIYERDRWRCQLCKKRIKRDLAWPDPMSASLDHVVPLSQGGGHDPANVQAAHLVCNTRKNNRGEPQQLALIG